MRIRYLLLIAFGATVALVLGAACGNNAQVTKLEKENKILSEIAGPPPASLDQYFPPQAPGPIFLGEMFTLSGAFEGIVVDLQEGDVQGAKANYDAFKAQYNKVSGMVPEWNDRFPAGPVDGLGKALDSGDPAKVGPAMGQVGQVCGSCHLVFQTKVHQKYHWPDFGVVKLTDPVTNESVPWVEYMMRMAGSFSGVGNDLQQGQLDNARKQYDALSARFKSLPAGCVACHNTPRTYFVDSTVQGMVDKLGQALKSTPPDGKAVGELMGGIGNESCMKCHLVHFPAASSKALWKALPDMLK